MLLHSAATQGRCRAGRAKIVPDERWLGRIIQQFAEVPRIQAPTSGDSDHPHPESVDSVCSAHSRAVHWPTSILSRSPQDSFELQEFLGNSLKFVSMSNLVVICRVQENLVRIVVASMDMEDPIQVSTLELLGIVPIRPTDSPQATRLLENVARAVMLDVTVHGPQIYFLCHAV